MEELKLIKTIRHEDHRGFFVVSYSRQKVQWQGINLEFVQDNFTISNELGTLRGLHFQAPPNAQAKLIRCSRGAVFDVAVDIRSGSPTYSQWKGYELTSENGYQLYVPIGFAHGFVTLEPKSEIVYKCSDYYAPEAEGSVLWNDPDVKIEWPLDGDPILSSKDTAAPFLKDFDSPFIYGVNS